MQSFTERFTSTRGGAITLGVLAAVIAAILLAVYITHYRSSVKSDTAPVQVLVAKRLIPAGTTGAQIGRKQLYTLSSVSESQLQSGALTDPGALNGQVTTVDIYPGSQIASSDFTATAGADGSGAVGGLTSQLKANQRAVAIQVDVLNGNLANLQPGDHVDIYQELRSSSGTIIKLFRSNVPVMQINQGADASGAVTGQIVVSVPARDSADMLYASKHTVLSFALRPAKGSTPTPSQSANQQSMLNYSRTH